MNMITALMVSLLRSLDRKVVTDSLYGAASAIVEFCNGIEKRSLRSCLKSYGFSCADHLDGWISADAVWTAICLKRPHLNYYPLGEIAERAVKKTIITMTLQIDVRETANASPNLGEKGIERNLRRAIRGLGIEEILKLFLSQYLFEVSIDYLRRSRKESQRDFGFWYHFSRDGYFVSLAAEQKLRQTLEKQCKERAGIFLPFLNKCLSEQDSVFIEQQISDGFEKTFGVPPLKERKAGKPANALINVVVGTKPIAELRKAYVIDKKVRRLSLHTKSSNVSFSFVTLESFLERPLHSLVKDLLDIGVIVYMSDLHTKREHHLGRRMAIIMPVRDTGIWNGARLEIARAVSFLARDDFSIQFTKRKERVDGFHDFFVKSTNRCVCLLSGGLDSVAGAAWAFERGLKPIFVSHFASKQLAGIQKILVSQIGEIYGQQLQHVDVFVSRAIGKKVLYRLPAPSQSILAQHLRSFLFLSLATAVALELGINKVYIFENGPVSLNPLLSEARVNTRTAHPHFLAYFRELVKAVFGIELIIENPFLYFTKGEVVRILSKPKFQRLIAKTNSCWNWFKVPLMAQQLRVTGFKGRHDGECLPCILRRTAVDYAGLWEKDTSYLIDVFTQFPNLRREIIPRETITAIADFLRFCQNMKSLPDTELLLHAPDFSVCAERTNSQKLVKMYKRNSEEVICCFRNRSSDMFRKIFASGLI